MRLYVYFKLHAGDAAAAQAAFEAARGDAQVELLQRCDESAGLVTWMEIYAEPAAPLEPRIAAAVAAWVVGERHVERFMPLPKPR